MVNKILEEALDNIDFLARYESIASIGSSSLLNICEAINSIEAIDSCLKSQGIDFKYDKRESFFAIRSTHKTQLLFGLNISPHEDFVRFILTVRLNNELLDIGSVGVWEGIYNLLKHGDEYGEELMVLRFESKEEIGLIIKEGLSIYDDFMKEVIQSYEKGKL